MFTTKHTKKTQNIQYIIQNIQQLTLRLQKMFDAHWEFQWK